MERGGGDRRQSAEKARSWRPTQERRLGVECRVAKQFQGYIERGAGQQLEGQKDAVAERQPGPASAAGYRASGAGRRVAALLILGVG